jgi:adenine-specific DNA-methyltransferase
MSDLRAALIANLAAFGSQPLPAAARAFFKTLGYQSDRTIPVGSVDAFCRQFDSEGRLAHPSALRDQWKSVHLVFQLTNEELSAHTSLFQDNTIKPGLLQSYLFFAIELTGKDYARGKLTAIARQINRVFPMPVMLLIRHGDSTGAPVLSIAVINRRQNKLHPDRDVLEKVTLIRDIALTAPHRGHLDILASFAVPNLVHPQRLPINNFDACTHRGSKFSISICSTSASTASWLTGISGRSPRSISLPILNPIPKSAAPLVSSASSPASSSAGSSRKRASSPKNFSIPPNSKNSSRSYRRKAPPTIRPSCKTSSSPRSTSAWAKTSNGKPYRVFAKDEGFQKNKTTYDMEQPLPLRIPVP